MANDIEIGIVIPMDEFKTLGYSLLGSLHGSEIFMELSADCVALNWARNKFEEWFEKQDHLWSNYVYYTAFSDKAFTPYISSSFERVGPDELAMVWYFEEKERDLALLFKLTFGGR